MVRKLVLQTFTSTPLSSRSASRAEAFIQEMKREQPKVVKLVECKTGARAVRVEDYTVIVRPVPDESPPDMRFEGQDEIASWHIWVAIPEGHPFHGLPERHDLLPDDWSLSTAPDDPLLDHPSLADDSQHDCWLWLNRDTEPDASRASVRVPVLLRRVQSWPWSRQDAQFLLTSGNTELRGYMMCKTGFIQPNEAEVALHHTPIVEILEAIDVTTEASFFDTFGCLPRNRIECQLLRDTAGQFYYRETRQTWQTPRWAWTPVEILKNEKVHVPQGLRWPLDAHHVVVRPIYDPFPWYPCPWESRCLQLVGEAHSP
jgi:hypothetical protein